MPVWGIILCFPFAYTLIALIIPSIILLANCTIIGKKEIYELLSWFMNTALGQNTTYPMWVKSIEVYTMQIWLMFCGMIVPAIFFGAFVYKLVFISEPFVFRKKVSLYQNIQNANNYILSIRLYNALLVPIADVRFRIFARIPYTARDNTKSVKNIELSLIDDSKKNGQFHSHLFHTHYVCPLHAVANPLLNTVFKTSLVCRVLLLEKIRPLCNLH